MTLCKMQKEERSSVLSRDALHCFSMCIKDKTVRGARGQAARFIRSIVQPLKLKFFLFRTHNRRKRILTLVTRLTRRASQHYKRRSETLSDLEYLWETSRTSLIKNLHGSDQVSRRVKFMVTNFERYPLL